MVGDYESMYGNFCKYRGYISHFCPQDPEIFLGLIWCQILAPSQFKFEQKLPELVYIIPNFLVLHFGENFPKMRTKIAKLQMHEN